MANTLVVNAKNCEQEEYAVALHQVAALSAKPVVRPENKLAAHSRPRIAEHHVGAYSKARKQARALGHTALRGPPRHATPPSNAPP